MSKGSYFSQYESPNIVIIPTNTPCNPPSPKRQKVGNNVVPIANNVSQLEEFKFSKENKKSKQCNVDIKGTDESSSINTSWASKYLQSIGIDKKSSIWNRKIPRKSSENVLSMQSTQALTSDVSSTSKCIATSQTGKPNQNKTPNKTVTNILKDKPHTSKCVGKEVKKHMIKEKPKASKQFKQASSKSVLVKDSGDYENSNNVDKLTLKNKDILNDQNNLKTNNITKRDRYGLQKRPENNNINKTSQKEIHPKVSTKKSSETTRSPNKVPKSNIKSVVVKNDHTQDKRKSIANNKVKIKQIKSTSSRPVVNYDSDHYKEKYKNRGCSVANVSPVIKVTKKCDSNKFDVSKKACSNIESKTKTIHNQTERINSKEKLSKTNGDANLNKTNKSPKSNKTSKTPKLNKINKSPIKKIVPKTKNYRKIKLIINLICNKSNPVQCNKTVNSEGNKCDSTCTIPNVDLDFLNDFNVDEIVESLYTGDKQPRKRVPSERELNKCHSKMSLEVNANNVKSNICYKNAESDATDLIKILKGEEDDDLVGMTMENAKTLLSSQNPQVLTQCNKKSQKLHNILNSEENEMLNSKLALPIRIKKEILELSKPLEVIGSTGTINLPHENITQNNMSEESDISLNIIKVENLKEKQQSKDPDDVTLSDISIVMGSTCEEVGKNTNKSYEKVNVKKKSSQLIFKSKSHPALNAINIDNINVNSNVQKTSTATENVDEQIINNKKDKMPEVLDNEHQKCPVKRREDKTVSKNTSIDTVSIKLSSLIEHQKANPTTTQNAYLQIVSNVNQIENRNDERYEDSRDYNVDNNVNYHANNVNTSDNYNVDLISNSITNQKSYLPKGNKDVIQVENVSNATNQTPYTSNKNTDVIQVENIEEQCKLSIVSIGVAEKNERPNKNSLQKSQHDDKGGSMIQGLKDDNKKNNDTVDNEQNYTQEDKQSKMSENITTEYQNSISGQDEMTQSNIKSKIGKQVVERLEERLVKCTGSKYSISTIIHTGKYSDVFKCKHPNGKYYALKMLKNTKYYFGKKKSIMVKSLLRDIPKNNLFIVNLANAFNVAEKWCFLMEFYPNNLTQLMVNNGKLFYIEQIQDFARQLVMAVMVLKNNNMVHLDIKPKHILISSSNKTLKLSGFDTLCYINDLRILPNVGTVNYRAPEVILGYAAGFEIDVWSTGLVLYEMAANRKLFPGMYNNNILYKQICTLGCIPHDMLKKSRFSGAHFVGSKFMKKSGINGKNINIISKFYKNNILNDSIYGAYFANWGHKRRSQQNCDMGKLGLLVKLLQKMLTVHPQFRLPIEFVYANPFIYEAYSCQE